MNFNARVALMGVLLVSTVTFAVAQSSTGVERLRTQLEELETKEAALQVRQKQIEEELIPENIEKYFALNGSTHPEELREQRRRQLESQRAAVLEQLEQLALSRTRLEAALATAQAASYRQSAYSGPDGEPKAAGGEAAGAQTKGKVRRKGKARARRAKKRG